MKVSNLKRDSCSSNTLIACASPSTVPESCQCNSRFKELDSFLSNLELEEHKRALLHSIQKFKTVSETEGKAPVGLPREQLVPASSFELCPVLHYEGLWINLSRAILKKESSPDNEGSCKSSVVVKQKVNQNLKPGVKKKVKSNPSSKVMLPKNSTGFQHNAPVDQILQVYRANNIYSKAHMRRVDKVAISNAIQSSMNYKQVAIPAVVVEPRVQVPRATCTRVVNLSFHRDCQQLNQQSPKLQGSKETSEHNKQTLLKPGMNNSRHQAFGMVVKQLFPTTVKSLNK